MKLSQNDKSLLLSCTEIPDVFFTEYLPEAKGDYIKVYFYMLFLSKYNKEIKINDLSKTLSLDFPTVKDSIEFWEEKGVLVKKTDGYILADIQEIELSKLYSPKVTSSPEDAIKNSQNQYRAKAIDSINSQFFSGTMSPSWFNDIDLWFHKYGFDEQVMLALFSYAFDKRALHKNYVQATAEAWSKNNIKTYNDLELYFEKQEKRNDLNNQISKKLNLYRPLTSFEEEDVVRWTENYKFTMDIIDIALKNAASKNKVRFDYINAILTDWHKKDLRTVGEVNAYLQSQKETNINQKQVNKVAFEYTQSTFDNLESLYEN